MIGGNSGRDPGARSVGGCGIKHNDPYAIRPCYGEFVAILLVGMVHVLMLVVFRMIVVS